MLNSVLYVHNSTCALVLEKFFLVNIGSDKYFVNTFQYSDDKDGNSPPVTACLENKNTIFHTQL